MPLSQRISDAVQMPMIAWVVREVKIITIAIWDVVRGAVLARLGWARNPSDLTY